MKLGEITKWMDWVVVLNSSYQVLLALAVFAGMAFSLPFLASLAPQYGPISQAIGVIGNYPVLGAIISLVINALFAMVFYNHIGKKIDGKDDFQMKVVNFVAVLTVLASIATMNGLGFVLSGYIVARLWKML